MPGRSAHCKALPFGLENSFEGDRGIIFLQNKASIGSARILLKVMINSCTVSLWIIIGTVNPRFWANEPCFSYLDSISLRLANAKAKAIPNHPELNGRRVGRMFRYQAPSMERLFHNESNVTLLLNSSSIVGISKQTKAYAMNNKLVQ